MLYFLKKKLWCKILPFALTGLGFLLMLLILSLNLGLDSDLKNVWQTASIFYDYSEVPVVCFFIVLLFVIECIFYLVGFVQFFLKKKKKTLKIANSYAILIGIVLILTQIICKMFSVGAMVLTVVYLIFMIISLVFFIITEDKTVIIETMETQTEKKKIKQIVLILNGCSFLALCSLFFVPLFSALINNKVVRVVLIEAISSTYPRIDSYFLFICFFMLIFGSLIYAIVSLPYYFSSSRKFFEKAKFTIYLNTAIALLFFLSGYFICFYYNLKKISTLTVSYIPLIIMVVILVIQSIFLGKYEVKNIEQASNDKKPKKVYKLEPLIFVVIITGISFAVLLVNVIEINFVSAFFEQNTKLTGLELMRDYGALGGGFQVLAFILFAILLTSVTLLILTLVSFLTRYKDYYKVVKTTVYANVLFMFLVGMSGIYYQIAQKINEENIHSLLEYFGFEGAITYEYTIKSQTLFVFAGSLVVLFIMLFRGQLNNEIVEKNVNKDKESQTPALKSMDKEPNTLSPENISFDVCPVFTELDNKKASFDLDYQTRSQNLHPEMGLQELVRFVVEYAKESRLHLSYTCEDIATFVAGLGASRLSILQGMSGTGKTSLPKIFAEAIMGNCEIIEVESSWRDKNELLGYYNEFSKSYTPKKFTQYLYKAKLNPDIPTFIVLDEMNLSRIEYYFSDFLSLMENEEDKREIKLLNIKLFREIDGVKYGYLGLEEGHTLKIPSNVWFIGTANKDESTFEISDKVYDRAQTMNFNKRAPKINFFNEAIPSRFVNYQQLDKLLKEAKDKKIFDAESHPLVQECERILQPYNISFGNRILKQMEEFVNIYCACFEGGRAVLDIAVEKILLSKVVAKLEFKNVDDKEDLAQDFEEIALHTCAAFIRKLNED